MFHFFAQFFTLPSCIADLINHVPMNNNKIHITIYVEILNIIFRELFQDSCNTFHLSAQAFLGRSGPLQII